MTTWILLRGLSREAGHWGDLPARLGAMLGAPHRVATPDLPGFGARHRERSPATIAGITRSVRHEVMASRLQPPYVLLGMSLGGMVALEWSRTHPAELSGAMLINTSVGGFNPFWQRLRPASYVRIAKLLPRSASPRASFERESVVLQLTSADPARHAGVVALWQQLAKSHPARGSSVLLQVLAAARFRQPDAPPAAPLLVLASRGDSLVSMQCSLQIAERWQLPVRVHPHAGHDLALDDPHWLLAQVDAWRNTLPEANRS